MTILPNKTAMRMLTAEAMAFSFGASPVLSDVNMVLNRGAVVGLAGRSGCGKTTLLRLLVGLLGPESGSIRLHGASETPVIGYAPQFPVLMPWKSVRANAEAGVRFAGRRPSVALVDQLLDVAGLTSHSGKYPGELSGGMRQRLSVIRALAMEPDVLVLDEPFSGSDWDQQLKLELAISEFTNRLPAATVVVSHGVERLVRLADQVVILRGSPATVGQVVEVSGDRSERLQKSLGALDPTVVRAVSEVWGALRDSVNA